MLKVQGHILLLIWMKQLQDDAPPKLALNQLAQIALQRCTDKSDHQTFTHRPVVQYHLLPKRARLHTHIYAQLMQGAETQMTSKTYECSVQVSKCKKQLSGTSGHGCCTVDTHQNISPPVNMFVLIELPYKSRKC